MTLRIALLEFNKNSCNACFAITTGYGKLAINFLKKLKTISKNWWSLDNFCCIPNNCEEVSYRITEFDKGKARGKEHGSSQPAKCSESSKNLSIFDSVHFNNADKLIIGHLNINSIGNTFEMLREIVLEVVLCYLLGKKFSKFLSKYKPNKFTITYMASITLLQT